MAKIFRGPSMKIKLGRQYDLWFVAYNWGKTVVKSNGTWSTIVSPQDSSLADYDKVLRGGSVSYTHLTLPTTPYV